MTDGIQLATQASWIVYQDDVVDTDFTLELDDDPLPSWDDITIEVLIEGEPGVLLFTELHAQVTKQPQVGVGPTVVTVSLTADNTAVPFVGTYRLRAALDDAPLTHREGAFRVRRTRDGDGTPTGFEASEFAALVAAIEELLDQAVIDGNDDDDEIDGGP